MIKIAHITNPCIVPTTSDLFVAQPITFESIKKAKEYAEDSVNVKLLSAQFSQDRDIVPADFELTPDLERSVFDIAEFQNKRNLPLHRDILDRLYHYSDEADYLIYTNVDIALKPEFYLEVSQLINTGLDAFVISRRTISQKYTHPTELENMYREEGKSHPGHDCFIFSRKLYPKFYLTDVCIGAAWFDKALLWNMIAYSSNFKAFRDLKLTFHLGDDKRWKSQSSREYSLHNKEEIKKFLNYLNTYCGKVYMNRELWPYVSHVYEKKLGFTIPWHYKVFQAVGLR